MIRLPWKGTWAGSSPREASSRRLRCPMDANCLRAPDLERTLRTNKFMNHLKHLLIVSIVVLPALSFAQTQEPVPFRLGGLTPLASNATQPVPRLPDGTVDLWGTWVGGGEIEDIEKDGGLKPGELDSLMLPSTKALMAARAKTPEKDPHNFCLPMGVPRQAGAFPWRFVQYPT